MSKMKNSAKFNVGQIITHKLFDYRGVIIDVDPCYQGTDEWYEQRTSTQPPKDQPWYHVLVDNSDRQTYVSERNLVADVEARAVHHPLLNQCFREFQDGRYRSGRTNH